MQIIAIKTKPILVTAENEEKIWKNIYGFNKIDGDDTIINPKFEKHDKVRISKSKGFLKKVIHLIGHVKSLL